MWANSKRKFLDQTKKKEILTKLKKKLWPNKKTLWPNSKKVTRLKLKKKRRKKIVTKLNEIFIFQTQNFFLTKRKKKVVTILKKNCDQSKLKTKLKLGHNSKTQIVIVVIMTVVMLVVIVTSSIKNNTSTTNEIFSGQLSQFSRCFF